jgi:hypothetical protein
MKRDLPSSTNINSELRGDGMDYETSSFMFLIFTDGEVHQSFALSSQKLLPSSGLLSISIIIS